jgi:2-oxoglutarate ferredoxin oxidoreductase subunit alpha
MPTWTEQGDLLFAVHAGHGEFPKIVIAPGDAEEMVELATEAFDLADIYQLPVIVLADKFICESNMHISYDKVKELSQAYTPNRGKIVFDTTQSPYLRYKDSEDGISEMLIPGKKDVFYQANSYEHLEDSHTSEDPEPRIMQVNKRQKKVKTYLKNHFRGPKLYGDPEARTVFVSWGGTKGIVLEAMSILHSQYQERTALLHFTHVFPLDEEEIKKSFSPDKRYVLVENNSHAQFSQLLRMHTGVDIKEKILKYDGRPIWPEEIVAYMVQSFEKLDEDQKMLIQKLKGSINTT